MKFVALMLLVTFSIAYCGPIDDGLLEPSPRRANPSPDAVILDADSNWSPYEPSRRREGSSWSSWSPNESSGKREGSSWSSWSPNESSRRREGSSWSSWSPNESSRRRFIGPFFERDDTDDDDDSDLGYGSFLGSRPFGLGFGFRPTYRDDFFTHLRRQMDIFRRYMTSFLNTTTFIDSTGLFPPNYDNSTYHTKVVNGSVISVNETIKKHTTNDSSFILTVKVIKVRPQNETTDREVEKPDSVPEEPAFGSWPLPGKKPEVVETTNSPITANDTTTNQSEIEMSNDLNPKGVQFR